MADDLFAHTPANFLIIDHLPFRQACVASLLRAHWPDRSIVLTPLCGDPLPAGMEAGVGLLIVGGDPTDMKHIEDAMHWLNSEAPSFRAAVLSFAEVARETVRAVFQMGAAAFLYADTDPKLIIRALDLVAAGGTFCSPTALGALAHNASPSQHCSERVTLRQQEVMNYLREGLSNKSIARKMDISEATVKIHVRHIMRRMGAKNRTQIALMASSNESAILPALAKA